MEAFKQIQVVEIPLDISYSGGAEERVTVGVVLDEADLILTEEYSNDDNIFYYLTIQEYFELCAGKKVSDEWEIL